jgi:hypothetical protein
MDRIWAQLISSRSSIFRTSGNIPAFQCEIWVRCCAMKRIWLIWIEKQINVSNRSCLRIKTQNPDSHISEAKSWRAGEENSAKGVKVWGEFPFPHSTFRVRSSPGVRRWGKVGGVGGGREQRAPFLTREGRPFVCIHFLLFSSAA